MRPRQIDRLGDAGNGETRLEGTIAGQVAQAEQNCGRVGDLGIDRGDRRVEDGLGAGAGCDGAAGGQIAGDQAGQHSLVDDAGAANDAYRPQAIGLEGGNADAGGSSGDGRNRHRAAGARIGRAEQKLVRLRAGIVEHIADGDHGAGHDDFGLEERSGVGRAGQERGGKGGDKGTRDHLSGSHQRNCVVDCIISSAPEMTRAFIS